MSESDVAWSTTELAEQLHCCIDIIEKLTAAGRIPHVRLGPRKVIYPKQQIIDWLAAEADASTVLFELEADGAHTGIHHQGVA